MPQAVKSRGFDPKLPADSNFCLCPSCGEYFRSVRAFDTHRIGGNCRSKAQMKARGMSVNAKGYWITQKYESGIHQPAQTDDRSEDE